MISCLIATKTVAFVIIFISLMKLKGKIPIMKQLQGNTVSELHIKLFPRIFYLPKNSVLTAPWT